MSNIATSYQSYLNASKPLVNNNNSRQNIPSYLNYVSHQRAGSTNNSVLAARCKEFLQNMN